MSCTRLFSFRPIPRIVMAGLAIAIILDTLVQLTWKATVSQAPADMWAMTHTLLRLPSFYLLLLMFIAQLVNWMAVLSRADLTFAQPITALSYITVAAGSYLCFGEHVNPTRLAGIAIILAGVFLVGSGGHLAPQRAPEPYASEQKVS